MKRAPGARRAELCQLVCRPILERFWPFSARSVRYWDDFVPGADAVKSVRGSRHAKSQDDDPGSEATDKGDSADDDRYLQRLRAWRESQARHRGHAEHHRQRQQCDFRERARPCALEAMPDVVEE